MEIFVLKIGGGWGYISGVGMGGHNFWVGAGG